MCCLRCRCHLMPPPRRLPRLVSGSSLNLCRWRCMFLSLVDSCCAPWDDGQHQTLPLTLKSKQTFFSSFFLALSILCLQVSWGCFSFRCESLKLHALKVGFTFPRKTRVFRKWYIYPSIAVFPIIIMIIHIYKYIFFIFQI